ncbi:MAG: NAD(FAD)-utilizing dehydrogenase [Curvibacter sp. RIFCSPHIGHO2_12_FULL_63_18]|uniref:TIGR03862 family flavoprotein n=1 Tax=Rhodoferax sp. TaxID=50421 RepID=UPI0008D360CB|nr:TIGR03862 family flavoprotein [Rhodoferax sp.]OGO96383.1 MAG: NAD(FAD)-utilizing dehydrogenase [Curvibacter sp. GWA2_63_95]OGP07059.1 MAG: NAD(FAD)-utilizing dehydrogenase [Curvibacter sp. RIFCSPHIGHO2_12_FULL_63_18]HCX80451.1 aminoacetone oxidase family FAD-binding enzyme [Rhodoferax sp.]
MSSELSQSTASVPSPGEVRTVDVAIVGGGPAGLMAAQQLAEAGVAAHLFDAMPSIGRKFLLAGKGGLNLTHSESADRFAERYGTRRAAIEALLQGLDATGLRAWAQGLGIETFVGSSGRVFPKDMKAAPLLRAWLQRLRNPAAPGVGVQFHMRHRWTGWGEVAAGANGTVLCFDTPTGPQQVQARAVVLALGGGSWARLGSNGAWVPLLAQRGVAVAPLLPANCGFDVLGGWSPFFADKFAGQPFKSVAIGISTAQGQSFQRKGEFVATATGVEGSLVYAASSLLRDEIIRSGSASFTLDLLPDMPLEKVLAEVRHPRGSRSLSSHLKSRLHLEGIKSAILHERLSKEAMNDPVQLAAAIKALPITLQAARPIDEAISTAGGVLFEVLTPQLMLEQLPGVFCTGEMLDWEAPTGGYLLQACFASGVAAGQGALAYLRQPR